MVKKNPDIALVLTKMTWCGHCKDFQEIFDNIKSRIKNNELLKNKEIVLETYDMEQKEAEFAKKYKDYMSKIDGYPTVFIFVKNKNKMHGDTIEHTVVEPSNKKNTKQLIDDATDAFISKVESKYKSVTNGKGEEYIQVQTQPQAQAGGGRSIGKCLLETHGTLEAKGTLETHGTLEAHGTLETHGALETKGTLEAKGGSINYEHKYKKYKRKYLELVNKYNE